MHEAAPSRAKYWSGRIGAVTKDFLLKCGTLEVIPTGRIEIPRDADARFTPQRSFATAYLVQHLLTIACRADFRVNRPIFTISYFVVGLLSTRSQDWNKVIQCTA